VSTLQSPTPRRTEELEDPSSQPTQASRWGAKGLAFGAVVILTGAGIAAGFLLRPSNTSRDLSGATAEAGVSDEEIVVGMSAALSGPSQDLGQGMRTGMRACFEEVNARGGIYGRRLNLIAMDDGYEPERCREAMRHLVEERKVFAIVGNVGTPTAQVAVPYAVGKKKVFFGAYTGAALLRKNPPDRYVFNYRASYVEEGVAMVKYLVTKRKVRADEIAVFAQNDGYGDAGFEGVVKGCQAYGVPEHKILRVGYKRNTDAVEGAVEEVLRNKDKIKAIVMVPVAKAAAKFIRLVREQKFDPTFLSVSFVNSDALLSEFRKAGLQYADGVIVTQVVPFPPHAAGFSEYGPAMAKYFPDQPLSFISLEGYIAARVFVAALQQTGPNLTTERFVAALESISDLDLQIGPRISFGPNNHQGSHQVWATVLDASGAYTPLVLD
jgi:ABC-type branched-subunit amino acid transport system substrate-binding protein